MAGKASSIFIGTSGWSYDHWRGRFYPQALPDEKRLAFYARQFSSVEINSSFYHLPRAQVLEAWQDAVPESFVFSVKASRYITHMKKLSDASESLNALLGRISLLGRKRGPVLFQLPPRWRFNEARFSAFLDQLDESFRYAFEFRDPSWMNERCTELLAKHRAALCIYDLEGFQSPQTLTADFAYVRLHGPNGAYRGSYGTEALAGWARTLSSWGLRGLDLYCYFDNDEQAHAPQNAARLRDMVGLGGGEG